MNDCASDGGENQGKQAVAKHADALEERNATTEQFCIHRDNGSTAPRDDEYGSKHQATII